MTVTIEKEPFNAAVYAEILPLGKKCWAESTINKAETCAYYGERDFEIVPDQAAYQKLADQELLLLVTVRDDGELKGYLVGFLYNAMHHANILCGIGDSIYIEPEYRAYTGVVAERFEKEMRARGVEIIGWPVHINGPVYEVLKARGYIGDDIVMELRLQTKAAKAA